MAGELTRTRPSSRRGAAGVTLAIAALTIGGSACTRPDPAPRYPMRGQILAVRPERQEITIKHEDIANYMPAMTMSYPVARADLLRGREPGELVTATLEVAATGGRIVEIAHAGAAPLPDDANQIAMAVGLLGPGDAVPDTALVDQDDRRRAFAEWRGGLAVVTFVYTRCPLPNFCPLMDQNFVALQKLITADPVTRGRVRLISVSFDPEHDTPAVLKAHATRLRADPAVWTFLTGDRVTIDRFAGRFGVGVLRDDPASLTHNLRTTLVDADGRVRTVFDGSDWTPARVLTELRAALGSR